MSDVVVLAIVSVAVTCVGASGIIGFSSYLEARGSHRLAVMKECRDALDFAAEQLSRSQRATAHCLALWSRGILDGDDEAKEYLRRRSQANDAMRTAYGRICLRLGATSPVARHYDEAIDCTRRLTDILRGYRAGDPHDAWEKQTSAESAELIAVCEKFLAVAGKAVSQR